MLSRIPNAGVQRLQEFGVNLFQLSVNHDDDYPKVHEVSLWVSSINKPFLSVQNIMPFTNPNSAIPFNQLASHVDLRPGSRASQTYGHILPSRASQVGSVIH